MSPHQSQEDEEREYEEDVEEDQDSRNTNNNKKRKQGVFAESGQTDAERRALRKSQRMLHQTMMQQNEENALEEARANNNQLFEQVAYTREAVLDGENLNLIASKYVQQVERLVQVPRYDSLKLVSRLAQKCSRQSTDGGSSYFDWRTLGREAGVCFNAAPDRVSFLAGMIDTPVEQKVRKARAPRQQEAKDDSETVKVQALSEQQQKEGQTADQLSAAEKAMKFVEKRLKERSAEQLQETGSPQVDGLSFLVNPQSFTQTVENIFNYSFMIKKGKASMRMDPVHGLVLRSTSPVEGRPFTQAVCALSLNDWRRLAQCVTKPDLPHRTGSKHAKTAAA